MLFMSISYDVYKGAWPGWDDSASSWSLSAAFDRLLQTITNSSDLAPELVCFFVLHWFGLLLVLVHDHIKITMLMIIIIRSLYSDLWYHVDLEMFFPMDCDFYAVSLRSHHRSMLLALRQGRYGSFLILLDYCFVYTVDASEDDCFVNVQVIS